MKTVLGIGIGLTSVMLLCGGYQTAPQQAAPAAQGQPGPSGQNGAQGQPGQQGQQGMQGQTGDTGQAGNPGQTGDTGDRGKPGSCPDGQHHSTDPDGKVHCVENNQ